MTTISKVKPKDIPDLLKMMRALCALHGDECQLGLEQAQHQLIHAGHLVALIAWHGNIRVGYAVLEPRWRPMHTADTLDIAHLYVSENMRGRGIGRALISAAAELAVQNGYGRVTIGTTPENRAAAAAYRAMGLTEITKDSGVKFEVRAPLVRQDPVQ